MYILHTSMLLFQPYQFSIIYNTRIICKTLSTLKSVLFMGNHNCANREIRHRHKMIYLYSIIKTELRLPTTRRILFDRWSPARTVVLGCAHLLNKSIFTFITNFTTAKLSAHLGLSENGRGNILPRGMTSWRGLMQWSDNLDEKKMPLYRPSIQAGLYLNYTCTC